MDISMPAITTDKKTQSSIIRYYTSALEERKVKIIKSSRGGLHLRFSYAGDFEKLLDDILPCSIIESEVSISGSFVTRELTINKELPDAKKGSKIYIVVAVSSKGELKTKQLTPDGLGFGGKTIAKTSFVASVTKAVNDSSAPANIKAFMIDLLEASGKSTNKISSDHIGSISDSDLNIIAKDFGELTGAWWYMNKYNPKTKSVTYPLESNAPLVDYYAHVENADVAISAKANEGAPPSIEAIAEVLRKMKYSDTKKEGARKAVIAIADNNTVDGIVMAGKNLSSAGYLWIKKNLFKNAHFSAADCEKVLAEYKTPAAVLADLAAFYKEIGRSASPEITKRIFDTKGKRWGLIISPMGYSLVDELNNNSTYLSVLNDAANTILVSQIYIKINKGTSTVDYTIKEFSESAFKFEYNANAGQPSLKKISFKLDKKAVKQGK